MSRCGGWLVNNSHRLIYGAGLGLSAYASGFGNAYGYQGYTGSQSAGAEVYAYGVFVGILAAVKAYALPGKDLQFSEIKDDSRSVSSEPYDVESASKRREPLLDHKPKPYFYGLKYVYLLADHFVSFNNLCFMGNAIANMIYAQQFESADQATLHPLVVPLWSLAAYASYYSLIDMPFITAVDGHTAHEEIFARYDKQSKQERPDKLANCFKQACIRSIIGRTQAASRVLGSVSHTATEVLPLLTAVNQCERLRDLYNSNYQPVFWLLMAVKLLSFVTVFAQTYYYEGREQKEAYEQFTKVDDECGLTDLAQAQEPVPSRGQYIVDSFLQKMLWVSVLAHGAAEGLSWLLYPATEASSVVRYSLAGFSVINELAGNARSEYSETMEEINSNISRYRQSRGCQVGEGALNDDASLQPQHASALGGQ